MNILVVSQYYYPEQFRINDICEELVRRGHLVTVLTGQPNYPTGELFEGYDNSEIVEEHNGVEIIRCKIIPRRRGKLNLIFNYISYALKASKKAKSMDNIYDIIYVYQLSPITSAIPALNLKKKFGIPIFLYCCDVWPESVRDTEGEPMSLYNPIYILAKTISRYVYWHVDRIGVKCNQFIDYLEKVCKIPRDKCCLLYEHAEDNYLRISDEPHDNGCYDFMFLGNIGIAQHCDYIVKAAEQMKIDKTFKVHFVGDGSGLDSLKKYVSDKGLKDKVVFHGRHPVSEVNKFYEFADCCMLTLSAKTATGLTPPAKLVGYMAASRPIIAAAVGATDEIVTEADCGVCVGSEDIKGIAKAMQYAVEHQEEFKEKGKRGRMYFKERFSLDKHVDSLENEFYGFDAKGK
jgi:glycosyltransferase involved in cell wall biosynthesis